MNVDASVVQASRTTDWDDAIALLSEGFPTVPWWPAAISRMAPLNDTMTCLLLKVANVSQGVMLLFAHTKTVQGQERKFINISSWYVRREFRRFTGLLLDKTLEETNAVHAIFTPSAAVTSRCLKAGFRLVSDGSILSLPFLNDAETRHRCTLEELDGSRDEGPYTSIVRDHAEAPFVAMALRDRKTNTRDIVICRIFLRRRLRFARLIYSSNSPSTLHFLGELKRFLFLRKLCFGIYLPKTPENRCLKNRFESIASPSILVKGDIPDASVDLLYSEYLYLPI